MLLPNLGRLSVTPTGLFYALTQSEADALNADGGKDPISLDKYRPFQNRDSAEATFRVRVQLPDNQTAYETYIAEGLWNWVRRPAPATDPPVATLPSSRQPIWREDWWALSDRYAPGVPYPRWVRNLPLSDPSVLDTKTYAAPSQQAQREFQGMDDEDEGEGEMEEEDWEELEQMQRERQRVARPSVRMPDWSEIAPRLRSYSARDDIETAMMLTRMMHGASGADRSARAYYNLTGVIGACIDRGSIASGRDEYRRTMINTISAGWLEPWFYDTIVVYSDRFSPPAVKGQLLRLLAAYVDARRVRTSLRDMDRFSGDPAGAFGEAVRRYLDHLSQLDPPTNASYTDEATFERNTKDARRIDALRVLHHLGTDNAEREAERAPPPARARAARAGGDFEVPRAARAGGDFEVPRARDGGETPNPRRQRRR